MPSTNSSYISENKGTKTSGSLVVDAEELIQYKEKTEQLTQEISLLRQNHKELIESLEAGFREELDK